MILFQMLCGRLPYLGTDTTQQTYELIEANLLGGTLPGAVGIRISIACHDMIKARGYSPLHSSGLPLQGGDPVHV